MRTPCLLLVFSCLLLVAPAQPNGGVGSPGSGPVVPPPMADDHFGEIVAGRFTSELYRDAAYLDDGELVLMMWPEVFRTHVGGGYTTTVNDLATQPAAVVDGRDALLVVGPSGLQRLAWDTVTEAWNVTGLESLAWLDATLVELGDIDGDGDLDAVGAGATTGTVVVSLGNGGGFGSTTTFNASGATIREVHLLDWDDPAGPYDAHDEIVLVTDAGVEVYDDDGTPLDGFAWTAWPLLGTEVRGKNGLQRLCLVTSDDGGLTESAILLGRYGMEGPFPLGSPGVVAADSWDRDGDGDLDVVLGVADALELVVLEYFSPNEPGATGTFDVTSGVDSIPLGDQTRVVGDNAASCVAADFDNDGDDDLLAPAQGEYDGGLPGTDVFSEVELVRGDGASHTALQVGITADMLNNSQGPGSPVFAWFDLGGPAQDLAVSPGLTPRWSFDVWHADSLDARLDGDPHHASGPITPPVDGYWFDLEGSSLEFEDVYVIVVRQVGVNGSGVVEQVGPANAGLFGDNDSYALIEQLPGIVTLSVALDDGDDGSETGGLGTGPTPPDSEEDEGVRGTGGSAGGSSGGGTP